MNSTSTITQKDGTQRIFNSGGYLPSIIDRNGNTTTIVVDGANQNRIASVTDPGGRTLTFNYSTPNFPRLCSSIQDSVGTIATYTYNSSSGLLTQVAYADGSQFNFTYNDPNSTTLISLVTDSLGKTIEAHGYDANRRGLTSQQANDANGNPVNKITVTYPNYSAGGPRLTQVENSLQQYNSLDFVVLNQRQYLTQVNSAGGCYTCGFSRVSTQASYQPSGYLNAFYDGYHNNSFSVYDGQGNLQTQYLPDGSLYGFNGYDTWNYTYNSFGEVLRATDPLGHTTTNQYDSTGNLLQTTTPSPDGGTTPGSTTYFSYYYPQGTFKTIKDPLGNVTTFTYYATGLVHQMQDANLKVTTYIYDGRGNLQSIQDPVNGSTDLPPSFVHVRIRQVSVTPFPG